MTLLTKDVEVMTDTELEELSQLISSEQLRRAFEHGGERDKEQVLLRKMAKMREKEYNSEQPKKRRK